MATASYQTPSKMRENALVERSFFRCWPRLRPGFCLRSYIRPDGEHHNGAHSVLGAFVPQLERRLRRV